MVKALFVLSTLVLVFASGCKADCEAACDKIILDCEAGIPSYNTTVCTQDCESAQEYYQTYTYLEDELAAFQDQLDCIVDASCEELLDADAPACYDNELYIFQ